MSRQHRGRRGNEADEPFSLDSGESLGSRVVRLQHLLFEEVYRLFRLEVSDPRLQEVVPTSLQLSPDLHNAKVMFAIRKPPEEAKDVKAKKTPGEARIAVEAKLRTIHEGLAKVTPFLRVRLAEAVSMKRLPDLHFHRDRLAESSLRASEIVTTEQKSPPPSPPAVDDSDDDQQPSA